MFISGPSRCRKTFFVSELPTLQQQYIITFDLCSQQGVREEDQLPLPGPFDQLIEPLSVTIEHVWIISLNIHRNVAFFFKQSIL